MVNLFDPNSVTTVKIAGSAVTTAKVANDAITNGKLADTSVSGNKVQALAILQGHVENGYIDLSLAQSISGIKTFFRPRASGDPVDGTDLTTKAYVDGAISAGGLQDLVEDTSPQLGGNLDANGNNITDDAGDLSIVQSGTSDINIGTANGGGGAVVLGIALDLNGKNLTDNTGAVNILSSGNSNIELNATGTGNVDANSSRIVNVTDPVDDQDAATKSYVDSTVGSTSAAVFNATPVNINDNSETEITWADEDHDTDGIHTGSSQDLVVPATGRYLILTNVKFQSDSDGFRRLKLWKDYNDATGTVLHQKEELNPSIQRAAEVQLQSVNVLTSGDHLSVTAFHTAGGILAICSGIATAASGISAGSFSITRI